MHAGLQRLNKLKFSQIKRKTASAKTKFQSFTDNYFPKNNIEMYT